MAHPKITKRVNGRLWHLEDSGLPYTDALALKRHLVHTEEKKSSIKKSKDGWQVWWTK